MVFPVLGHGIWHAYRALASEHSQAEAERAAADLLLVSTSVGAAEREAQFVVPEIHCAGCIARIERALTQCQASASRVNLSTKRVRVRWGAAPPPIVATLARLG